MAETPKPKNWSVAVEIGALVVMLSTAGLLAWTVVDSRREGETGRVTPPPRSRVPAEPLSLAGAAVRGSQSAKFAVVEFGDYQCPACSRFAQTILPGFLDRYVETGQVLFAYRHLPLERIHPLAVKAAEAAECGRRQNRFWEMNEALYAAGIDPSKAARKLTPDDHHRLHAEIRRILEAAIRSNGSTVRDYRTGTGEAGNFQLELLAYGREGEPCRRCGTRLTGTHTIDARITVFCHRCQS